MSSAKKITVIVTTKNNQRTITKCLKSILNQNHPADKIIVVDNFSTDKTKILIEKINSKKIFFYQKGPERSAQRNFALRKVNCDFFMIVDSDQYLSPTVLQNCLAAAEKKDLMIAVPEKNIENSLVNKLLNTERNIITRKVSKDIPRFFPYEVIQKVGYLSEEISFAEDLDYKMRAIEKGFLYEVIEDEIIHDENDNLFSLFKKNFYYGSNSKIPQKKNRKKYFQNYLLINPQLFLNFFYYLIRNPFITIGAVFLRVTKIFFFMLGFLKKKLIKNMLNK